MSYLFLFLSSISPDASPNKAAISSSTPENDLDGDVARAGPSFIGILVRAVFEGAVFFVLNVASESTDSPEVRDNGGN